MMLRMMLYRSFRSVRHGVEDTLDFAAQESRLVLRNVGLVSASITALAMGVVVGRELRQRYKFKRRTPYDIYARSGSRLTEASADLDYGVGV